MKRILVAGFALLLVNASLQAQTAPARPADSTQPANNSRKVLKLDLRKELGFSDEQSAKWDLITSQTREKLATINENGSLGKEERKQQRTAVMKDQESRLQAILTDTQKTTLKELRKERRKSRKKAG
ncbi:MAG: hypothetical protein EOO09_01800 [Chitinophagaceae bacterium]|nr:MAG: hypothetical protein EOO09_01800 [Chitinophagaceae bacterium]